MYKIKNWTHEHYVRFSVFTEWNVLIYDGIIKENEEGAGVRNSSGGYL